jgi:hypothetical protein
MWGRLEDSVLRLGLMGVQTSYAHRELTLSTRGMTLADLGLTADIGAVQKTCRQIGRAPPRPAVNMLVASLLRVAHG